MYFLKSLTRSGLLATCFLLSIQAPADGDPDKGAGVFESVCTMCHGSQAQGGEDFEAPKLAGQHGWYLERQLNNFRKGVRGTHKDDDNGQVMQPMASGLSDRDVKNVVAYIITLDANYIEEE